MRGREVVITGMGVVSPIANELNLLGRVESGPIWNCASTEYGGY